MRNRTRGLFLGPLRSLSSCVLSLSLAFCLVTGCASGRNKRPQAPSPIPPEQQFSPMQGPAPSQPIVYFRGMFANQMIPWQEGLTLAQGLLEAEFRGVWDPTEIVVIRQGRVYRVNANRMLRGQENPLLEPNDIVEIRR